MQLRSVPYKWLVATAFVCGLFMDIMDSTITNVALPRLTSEFHTTTSTIEWVVTGYLLSLAIWVPASGWIGDKFGTKKTFVFALFTFTVASVLCGLSWNVGSLIVFRVLQGVGGGMLTPVGAAMLFRAFPPNERASASAVLAFPALIAPATGPILGGWLVDAISWRWIFFVNLPIGLLGVIFSLLFLREQKEETAGRFDFIGFVTSGAGLALMLYGLSRGPEDGWSAPQVVGALGGGAVLLAVMAVYELRTKEPMLALRLFANRMFRNSNLFMFAAVGSMLGVLFLLPLFLQELRGLSALQSGLTTFPQAIGMALVVPLTSRLYPRIGPRRMMLVGITGAAITTFFFLFVDLQTDLWWIRAIMFLRGGSMAWAMIPIQAATFSTITLQDTGRASALMNTNQRVAASVGVAVLATVLTQRLAANLHGGAHTSAATAHAGLLAYHDAFFAGLLICLLGIASAFLIHDEDAEASMRRAAPSVEEAGARGPVAVA
jgi:EmrB/QacA subfamily drug resistance transporter